MKPPQDTFPCLEPPVWTSGDHDDVADIVYVAALCTMQQKRHVLCYVRHLAHCRAVKAYVDEHFAAEVQKFLKLPGSVQQPSTAAAPVAVRSLWLQVRLLCSPPTNSLMTLPLRALVGALLGDE